MLGIHGLATSNTLPHPHTLHLERTGFSPSWVMKSLFLTFVESHHLFTEKSHLFILVYFYHDVTAGLPPFTHLPPWLPSLPSTLSPLYYPDQHVDAAQLGNQTSWGWFLDTNCLQQPTLDNAQGRFKRLYFSLLCSVKEAAVCCCCQMGYSSSTHMKISR